MTDRRADDALLNGIDGPRPLPADLRQRLEDRLLAETTRSLEPAVAGRITDALTRSDSETDGRRRWARRNRLAAAAAAGLLIAGGAGLVAEQGGGGRARPAASRASTAGPVASPAPSGQAPGAAPPSAASASGAAPYGAQGAASAGAGSPSALNSSLAALTVTPSRGPAAGGTWVTITGGDLQGATAVRFGARPAPRLVVVSATQVRALTPPGTPGTVPVSVITRSGTVTTAGTAAFTYTST